MRLHDDIIKLEHVDFMRLDLKYEPCIQTDGPPKYKETVLDYAPESSATSSKLGSNCEDEWRVSVRIPIQPHETILPIFCAGIISRSYSLILRVRVAGLRTRTADFEIPL